MQLQLQTFTTMVGNTVAAIQGAASQLLDLTVGSTLRAIVEANASLGLWMQWLMVLVLRTTRAATSTGTDLDTWMADFGVTRIAAVSATGSIVFSRFSPVATAFIPVGTTVRTSDGTESFAVSFDDSNPAFSPASGGNSAGFQIAAGVASLTVAAYAVTPGSAGNVQPDTITLITTALPGVDTVSNPGAFTGGLDAESDASLRARFGMFLASRTQATLTAVEYAVASVQQGLATLLVENQTPDGRSCPGTFTLTVDDGSGSPPASLLAAISAAVETVRPLGSSFTVQPPTVLRPTVTMTIVTAPGADHSTIVATVTAALSAALSAMPIGGVLAFSRLTALAYAASPSVTNVTAVSLNGGSSDLVPPISGLIKPGTITVS
jgi:uncharacterized phage protein gp47/JayE